MSFRFTNLTLRPCRQLSRAPSQAMSSQALRAYLSGAALDPGAPDTITITVGTTEPHSSWTLPKTLLAQRSYVFNSLFIEDTKVSDKHFPAITPYAFANFADYVRSSIYSTNTQVTGYNAIRAHVDACILGAQLGADEYRKAALRSLHALFAPGAHASHWNATRSIIGAEDMKYVCERAGAATLVFAPCITDIAAMMKGLRYLCYDALAAHWTQRNVVFFIAPRLSKLGWGLWRRASQASSSSSKQVAPPVPPKSTWSTLFERFPEFRERMVKTSDVTGLARAGLLKDVKEYFLVFGDVESDTSDFSSDSDSDSESDDESGRKLGIMFKPRERKSTAAQGKRQRLTLKLRGLRNTREGEVKIEEQDTTQEQEEEMSPQHIENIDMQEMGTQTEEDMRPQHIENIDANEMEEEELPVMYRVESHEGGRVITE